VRLLGQTGKRDEPGTPMKVVRAPTPPVLPKPTPRMPAETGEPAKGARTGRVDELRAKLEERQYRVSAAAKGAEGGERSGARGPAGAEGGLSSALERMRTKIEPESCPESCEVESINWDE